MRTSRIKRKTRKPLNAAAHVVYSGSDATSKYQLRHINCFLLRALDIRAKKSSKNIQETKKSNQSIKRNKPSVGFFTSSYTSKNILSTASTSSRTSLCQRIMCVFFLPTKSLYMTYPWSALLKLARRFSSSIKSST